MKRFILILVALLVVATGFAQPKKVNLDIKTLKELVGVATYEKVDSLLGFQTTLESGEKVFQGLNEYEKMLLAYRCRFNEKNILQSIEFVSRSCTCPTAVIIGTCVLYTARTTVGSLKHHKSSMEPPPRARIRTSKSRFFPASSRALTNLGTAPSP